MNKQYTITFSSYEAVMIVCSLLLLLMLLYVCHRWQLAEERLAHNPGHIVVTKAVLVPPDAPTNAEVLP